MSKIMIALLMLTLFGCGSSGRTVTINSPAQQLPQPQNPQPATPRDASVEVNTAVINNFEKALAKIWTSDCATKTNGAGVYVSSAKMTFNDHRYEERMIIYDSTASSPCMSPTAALGLRGSYVSAGAAKDDKGGNLVDITDTEFFVIPFTKQAADRFNESKYCGRNNWRQQTEQIVNLSADCVNATSYPSRRRLLIDSSGTILKYYSDLDSSEFLQLRAN